MWFIKHVPKYSILLKVRKACITNYYISKVCLSGLLYHSPSGNVKHINLRSYFNSTFQKWNTDSKLGSKRNEQIISNKPMLLMGSGGLCKLLSVPLSATE